MTDARGSIERFNAAWERGDLAEVSACLAEDVYGKITAPA